MSLKAHQVAEEPSEDILWKQYELHVGLYKEYLNLLLKFNVFYYAATGALISYYFSNQNKSPWMKYSLLFPVLMSIGFAFLFFYGASQTHVTRQELFSIRDRLKLSTAPEYRVLTIFLWLSAILLVIVAVSLLVLIFFLKL
jgi:hypothetical protein